MKSEGIIGGPGFIGSYITKKFLEEGIKVKESATDISNKAKYQHLQNLKNAGNLEIAAPDVEDEEMLKVFVDGCQIPVHGGTPFQLDVKNPEKELFDPTVKGTENFLKVIAGSIGVEKVVFIASAATYNAAFPMQAPDPGPFVEMLYEQNVEFALVDVADVADGVFKAAAISGLHGKNYLLTGESRCVSDISLMLNDRIPENEAKIICSKLAAKELGVDFKPAAVPLKQFS